MDEFFNTDSKNTIIIFNGKAEPHLDVIIPIFATTMSIMIWRMKTYYVDVLPLNDCLFIYLFSINWLILFVFFVGPPRVAFSWRHWAHWTGPYKGKDPTGELLEMFGMAVAEVDENLKIKSIDVHYDPNQILIKLEGQK